MGAQLAEQQNPNRRGELKSGMMMARVKKSQDVELRKVRDVEREPEDVAERHHGQNLSRLLEKLALGQNWPSPDLR